MDLNNLVLIVPVANIEWQVFCHSNRTIGGYLHLSTTNTQLTYGEIQQTLVVSMLALFYSSKQLVWWYICLQVPLASTWLSSDLSMRSRSDAQGRCADALSPLSVVAVDFNRPTNCAFLRDRRYSAPRARRPIGTGSERVPLVWETNPFPLAGCAASSLTDFTITSL